MREKCRQDDCYAGVHFPKRRDGGNQFNGFFQKEFNNPATQDDATDAKNVYVFTFDVTPDNANDQITLSNALIATGTNSFSHVLISGAAIGVIPEPSSLALLSLGGLLAFRRRR